MVISIIEAKYTGDFTIEFEFSDRVKRAINFRPFLEKSRNPMTKKYLKEEYFKNFQVEHGDIVWNDYEMCFPIWDLHEGAL